jgi:hypothetical protein
MTEKVSHILCYQTSIGAGSKPVLNCPYTSTPFDPQAALHPYWHLYNDANPEAR